MSGHVGEQRHLLLQLKAQEAARYAREQEIAQREAAEEKQRRNEAYMQCVLCTPTRNCLDILQCRHLNVSFPSALAFSNISNIRAALPGNSQAVPLHIDLVTCWG
jgi:hypothetical protein